MVRPSPPRLRLRLRPRSQGATGCSSSGRQSGCPSRSSGASIPSGGRGAPAVLTHDPIAEKSMAVNQALFRENSWLRGLKPATVATLTRKAIVRRLANGELWVSRTERAGGIAVVVEGGLRSTTFTAEGKEHVFLIMK